MSKLNTVWPSEGSGLHICLIHSPWSVITRIVFWYHLLGQWNCNSIKKNVSPNQDKLDSTKICWTDNHTHFPMPNEEVTSTSYLGLYLLAPGSLWHVVRSKAEPFHTSVVRCKLVVHFNVWNIPRTVYVVWRCWWRPLEVKWTKKVLWRILFSTRNRATPWYPWTDVLISLTVG